MNHHQAKAILADLATGRLKGTAKVKAESHLERCTDCETWIRTYQFFSASLSRQLALASDHLASEQLAKFAVDPSAHPDAERQALLQHIGLCRDCLHQLELARGALSTSRLDLHGWRRIGARIKAAASPSRRLALAASILLAIIVGFVFVSSQHGAKPRERRISHRSLKGDQVVSAAETISAADSEISSGAQVTFRSGNLVILEDGFSVASDASFVVEITEGLEDMAKRRGSVS